MNTEALKLKKQLRFDGSFFAISYKKLQHGK